MYAKLVRASYGELVRSLVRALYAKLVRACTGSLYELVRGACTSLYELVRGLYEPLYDPLYELVRGIRAQVVPGLGKIRVRVRRACTSLYELVRHVQAGLVRHVQAGLYGSLVRACMPCTRRTSSLPRDLACTACTRDGEKCIHGVLALYELVRACTRFVFDRFFP